LPKIHINGKGEHSGLHLWYHTLQLVGDIYAIYAAGSTGVKLNVNKFPEFASWDWITWSEFCQECDDRELKGYNTAVIVVEKLKRHTLDAMELFREHVMESRYMAEESQLILSTCHSAKGMEWDYVQVCDDFLDLCCFKCTKRMTIANTNPAQVSLYLPPPSLLQWQFDFESYGDEVNLAYVACTRAKRVLSIPTTMAKLLRLFDSVHAWHGMQQQQRRHHHQQQRRHHHQQQQVLAKQSQPSRTQTVGFHIPGRDKPLTEMEAIAFYNQLVLPLRKEFGLNDDVMLCDFLLDSATCPSSTVGDCNNNHTSTAVHGAVDVVTSMMLSLKIRECRDGGVR